MAENMEFIAQGGFNTGRLYAANGQEVYWWLMPSNKVVFYDRSRMIIGELEISDIDAKIFANFGLNSNRAGYLMRLYDAGRYKMACQPARIPEGFDFGPMLRI